MNCTGWFPLPPTLPFCWPVIILHIMPNVCIICVRSALFGGGGIFDFAHNRTSFFLAVEMLEMGTRRAHTFCHFVMILVRIAHDLNVSLLDLAVAGHLSEVLTPLQR